MRGFNWLAVFIFLLTAETAQSQLGKWQKGVVVDEFIFDTASFPESHAATIVETPKGLVAAWFGGTKERNPDVEIRVSRRVDGRWTAPVSVADGVVNDTLRYPTWNPVLYQVPKGDLLLFYKIGPSPGTWKGWIKTSKDGGRTWSAVKALPDGFVGPVKNKPVMLSNGILLCPSSKEGDRGWTVHLEASADSGNTWQLIGPINDGKAKPAIQPSILTYPGGRLQLLARGKGRALMEAWSTDNGKTWSDLHPTSLPNNNSGTDAVTARNGRQYLVYNHVLPPADAKNGKGARTPLNLAYSKDGKTWYAAAILEDSPISQYSYPSIIQSKDGMLHVVYTWRRKKIKYVRIDPAKLAGKKIIDGQWPALSGYKAPLAGEVTND